MKIVLDTNVLVSGLLNRKGHPAAILALLLSGAVVTCHNRLILAEYAEVLGRPRFKFDPLRVREVLIKLESDGLAVGPSKVTVNLPDPDDAPFLDAALAASADYLVTGNLADYPPTDCHEMRVVSPAQFIALWRVIKEN